MDNALYQITGKQATATGGVTDIVAVARGAGIANAEWVRDDAHFSTLTNRRFDDGGPVLLAVRMTTSPVPPQPPRDPALVRNRFMKGLGVGRAGLLDSESDCVGAREMIHTSEAFFTARRWRYLDQHWCRGS